MIGYHCTTSKKLGKYESTGAILPPVRFWSTEYFARRWMKKVGRSVLLCFDVPDRYFPLPIKGGAYWSDCLVRDWEQIVKSKPLEIRFRRLQMRKENNYG